MVLSTMIRIGRPGGAACPTASCFMAAMSVSRLLGLAGLSMKIERVFGLSNFAAAAAAVLPAEIKWHLMPKRARKPRMNVSVPP